LTANRNRGRTKSTRVSPTAAGRRSGRNSTAAGDRRRLGHYGGTTLWWKRRNRSSREYASHRRGARRAHPKPLARFRALTLILPSALRMLSRAESPGRTLRTMWSHKSLGALHRDHCGALDVSSAYPFFVSARAQRSIAALQRSLWLRLACFLSFGDVRACARTRLPLLSGLTSPPRIGSPPPLRLPTRLSR